jgi:hypothetical protein
VKHLLLILISLLLLSSFLTSCEKKEETLYRWETSSGWEWKRFGDKDNNPYYQGEVKREYILFGDYIFEGQGTHTYLDGSNYVGEYKDGKIDGQGTFTWSNGNKYVGEWKDGEPNGQGTFTSSGSKYVGGWKDGEENGQGIFTWSNGRKYLGEYKDGKRNGQGTYTFSDGRKYVGEIKDNNFWNGIRYDKDGEIFYKVVNGEFIKQ